MDLPQTIETKIRAEARSRFTKLALPGEFVAPNYHGRSIVNVSISIARLLGARTIGLPLDAEILDGLDTDVRRIVLVIVDALGYSLLLKAMNEDASNGFHSLLQLGARILPVASTRLLVYAATLIRDGMDPTQACRVALVETLSDDPEINGALMEPPTPLRNNRHKQMGIVLSSRMDYMPAFVYGPRVAVCVHFLGVKIDIAPLHNKPQLLSPFKESTGGPNLNFHRNNFAALELYFPLVLVVRPIRC